MDLKLNGKTALVSGSTSGIGASIAKILAAEGAAVAIQGRNAERAQKLADEIAAAGGKAIVALGDLSKDEDGANVVKTVLDAWGGVDILVNNAAAFPMTDWTHANANAWTELYNANVGSMIRLIAPLIAPMKQRGWGRIIQISSTGAINAPAFVPDYAATKGAILTLTVSLSKELAKTGITVNTVSPGPVETEGVEKMVAEIAGQSGGDPNDKDAAMQQFRSMWTLVTNRIGLPEDIGNMVAYLASPLADYISGANFRVDGGHVTSTN